MVGTFPGVVFGPLSYRRLVNDKDDYDHKMCLSPGNQDELKWWITALPTAVRYIAHANPDITLTTDASHTGWSATVCAHQAQGLWPFQETNDYNSNILELRPIELGLLSLLRSRAIQHIRIISDNMTAITYIIAMGGVQSKECNLIAKRIWLWAIDRRNWLSVTDKPEQLSRAADKLSRHFVDSIEWQLNPRLFDQICSWFGNLQLDLFASRVNHLVAVVLRRLHVWVSFRITAWITIRVTARG